MVQKEYKINKFQGIQDDPRIENNGATFIYNFDIDSSLTKLSPTITDQAATATSTYDFNKLCYVLPNSAGTDYIYALGVNYPTNVSPKIFRSGTPCNSQMSFSAMANGTFGAVFAGRLFNYYKDYIYISTLDGDLEKFGPLSGTPSVSVYGAVTNLIYSTEGIVGKDDNLYWGAKNLIHRVNGTTVQQTVLTLPENYTIKTLLRYGNYLAILAQNNDVTSSSAIFLWDYISDDITEKIDFAQERLITGGIINGAIYAITSNVGISTISEKQPIKIFKWNGGNPTLVKTVTPDVAVQRGRYAVNTYGYFSAIKEAHEYKGGLMIPLETKHDTVKMLGMLRLSIGIDGELNVSFDAIDTTEIGSSDTIKDSLFYGDDMAYLRYIGTDRTEIIATYPGLIFRTAVWESQIISGGNPTLVKQLDAITVDYSPLLASSQVVLKYRKDAETAWTEIFTDGTNDAISHESVNIESTGLALPQFKEIQFQITSTAGAEITGLRFKYTELNNVY